MSLTPAIIDESTLSEQEQLDAAAYRSAVEGMSAVLYQIALAAGDSGFTTDDIISELAADLADGEIDAVASGVPVESYNEASLTLFDQDPATLPIPGDDLGRTVGDVKALVIEETEATGSETDTGDFESSEDEVELQPATTDPDKDDDGVDNAADAYPEDPGADTDTDGDGQPDIAYFVLMDSELLISISIGRMRTTTMMVSLMSLTPSRSMRLNTKIPTVMASVTMRIR